MLHFVMTFIAVFIGLLMSAAVLTLLTSKEPQEQPEGKVTSLMNTTGLLGTYSSSHNVCDEDFVIEQDLVYAFDPNDRKENKRRRKKV